LSGAAPTAGMSGQRKPSLAIATAFVELGLRGGDFIAAIGAELDPSAIRFRRAARMGLVTAVGAGILASMQIPNALGLTLIVNFAAAELAFDLNTAVLFVCGSAIIDALALPIAGATVDMPGLHLIVFFTLAVATTYAIYSSRQLGRLWVWAQLPLLTAYYMMVYQPDSFGVTLTEMWSGCALGVVLLLIVNRLLWPESPARVLISSIAAAARRSERRLAKIVAGAIVDRREMRPIASRLGHHLELLGAAGRRDPSIDFKGRYNRIAAVIAGERIRIELDAVAREIFQHGGSNDVTDIYRDAARTADSAIAAWCTMLVVSDGPANVAARGNLADATTQLNRAIEAIASGDPSAVYWRNIADILARQSDEPPELPTPETYNRAPVAIFNRFVFRFSIRHSIALIAAFIFGLIEHDPAVHAALWVLMIGGPPSHGATVRKFTVRIIGAGVGGLMAVVAIIVFSPNFTSIPPYMAAIFAGAMIMAYIGQGGGLLAYMAIGATVFLIALSGVAPRDDVFASLWTVWGIMIGIAVRAAISMVWRERPPRTLVEQFEPIIAGLIGMVALFSARGDADRSSSPALTPGHSAAAIVDGVSEMIAIVNDADMEGPGAGIDSAALLEVLESILIVTDIAARPPTSDASADSSVAAGAIYRRMDVWREFLRRAARMRRIPPAPLRMMVQTGRAAGQADALSTGSDPRASGSIEDPSRNAPDDIRLIAAFLTLEDRFERVWIDRP